MAQLNLKKTPKRELNFIIKQSKKPYIDSIAKEVVIYTIQNDGPKILFVHGWNEGQVSFIV